MRRSCNGTRSQFTGAAHVGPPESHEDNREGAQPSTDFDGPKLQLVVSPEGQEGETFAVRWTDVRDTRSAATRWAVFQTGKSQLFVD